MTTVISTAPAPTRAEAITDFLEGFGVRHELLEHPPTMSAAAAAQTTHYPPEQVAKTVVLQDGNVYVIAAVPATERLDLHKLRQLLGASRRGLRMATETEMACDFPVLEVGAIPPFGPMVPAAEVIDVRLMDYSRILCSAGDHRHSLLIDPLDVVRITAARTADICQD
jgi:Ala-tRNA(Pro) deacylase